MSAALAGCVRRSDRLKELGYETLVNQSPRGWFADELAETLHVEVQDPLHDLVRTERLRRAEVAGRFLYTSAHSRQARDQLRARQTAQSVPLVADASALQVSPDEPKAAILLFYSLLDEQQRRLFAGLESMKLGHGGDSILAHSSAWIPTPSPGDVTNCLIGR